MPAAGDLPTSSVVTLVGTPATALATARAFAAVPGVSLRLRTPTTYAPRRRASRATWWCSITGSRLRRPAAEPGGAADRPDAPARKDGSPACSTKASSAARTPATNCSKASSCPRWRSTANAATRLTPPAWLAPVVWSPDGVLLAAGADGRQRVAALAFEPGQSNLTQLPALPILAANLVRWASGWAPAAATAGVPFTVEAASGIRTVTLERGGAVTARVRVTQAPVVLDPGTPGLYSVRETGPGTTRTRSRRRQHRRSRRRAASTAGRSPQREGRRRQPGSREPSVLVSRRGAAGARARVGLLGHAQAASRACERAQLQPSVRAAGAAGRGGRWRCSPRRRLPRGAPRREWLWLALQALAPALLVLALAGPQLHSGSGRPTVLAVDQSASIDASMRALERRWTAQVAEGRLRIAVPGGPLREHAGRDATRAGRKPPGLEASATDLQSAIGAAIGLRAQRRARGGAQRRRPDAGRSARDRAAGAAARCRGRLDHARRIHAAATQRSRRSRCRLSCISVTRCR